MKTLTIGILLSQFGAVVATAQNYTAYFGLLHAHTHYSDGVGTPEEAFDAARDTGLDFFAVTPHNHAQAAGSDGVFLTQPLYESLKATAQEKTEDGHFVAIWGQELSTISKGNHVNVLYAPDVCDMPSGHFRYLYDTWMPSQQGTRILQMNHPKGPATAATKDYGIDDYAGDFPSLVEASEPYLCLMEMVKGSAHSEDASSGHINASYEDEYFYYLNKGFRIAPSCGGDNHKQTWGRALHGRMGVWATEHSRAGLEEAMINRRCFASEDGSIEVQFLLNQEPMGSLIETDETESVTLDIRFEDPDEPNARHRVQVYYDDAIGGDKASLVENDVYEPGVMETTFSRIAEPGGYFFVKVVQIPGDNDDPLANHPADTWTAPIWLVASDGTTDQGSEIASNTDDPPKANISWEEAVDYIGETVTVTGIVIRSHKLVHNGNARILFLNFDANFRDTLSLVVFDDDFSKFGGVDALAERAVGKEVTVRGKVTVLDGAA